MIGREPGFLVVVWFGSSPFSGRYLKNSVTEKDAFSKLVNSCRKCTKIYASFCLKIDYVVNRKHIGTKENNEQIKWLRRLKYVNSQISWRKGHYREGQIFCDDVALYSPPIGYYSSRPTPISTAGLWSEIW